MSSAAAGQGGAFVSADPAAPGPPSGPAGGDLAGTYPNPDVRGLHETAGPTQLLYGAIADGQVLTRSGGTVIGTAPGGPPSGAAGGDLAGTYPNPDVRGLHETAGPTQLLYGAIADGQVLTRSGGTVIGTAPGGPPSGAAGGDLAGTYPNPDVRGLHETSGPTQLLYGAIADGQVLTRSGGTVIGTAPGGAVLPKGYIHGFHPYRVGNMTVSVESPGACRDETDTTDIIYTGADLFASLNVTGAGGRNVDTAEQASTWYQINLIEGAAVSPALFLINENDLATFTWPAGYTVKRRRGWILNDASSNLIKGEWKGLGSWLEWYYDCDESSLTALAGGSATVWTPIDLSAWVPPTYPANVYAGPRLAILRLYAYHVAAGATFLRKDGSSVAAPAFDLYNNAFAESNGLDRQVCDGEDGGSRRVEYKTCNGGNLVYLMVRGYTDFI